MDSAEYVTNAIIQILTIFAAITIDFDQTSYTVSEGDAPLEVCAVIVSLMGNLDCDLVVTFSELPDTAGMTINHTVARDHALCTIGILEVRVNA